MEPAINDPKKSKPSNSYLKYGNLTLQLFGAIGLAAWLGHKLDASLELRFPAFLMTFVLVTFGGMMFVVYRSINKD